MKLLVDNYLRINYQSAKKSGLISQLEKWVVFDENRYYKAQSRAPRVARGRFEYAPFFYAGEDVLISRGLIGRLRALPLSFELLDKRIVAPIGELPAADVRDYQARAVDWAIAQEQGLIYAETGSGKTRIGISIISRIRQRTLIFVPSLDIMEQFLEDLRLQLGITPGIFGGGQEFLGDEVTVALCQWYRPELAQKRAKYAHLFGCIIMDECHLGYRKYVEDFPAKYRFGLTATPNSIDNSSEVTQFPFGRMLHVASHNELVDAGVRVHPDYEYLHTEFECFNPTDYAAMLRELVHDEKRSELICLDIRRHWSSGRTILVLCGQREYGRIVLEKLLSLGVPAALLTGDIAREQRKGILDQARKGSLKVLVATSLADVGLDVPLLDTLYLAFPARSTNLTTQRIGRIMRRAVDKSAPLVVDVVDDRVPVLWSQALTREAVLRAFEELPKKLTRRPKHQRKI